MSSEERTRTIIGIAGSSGSVDGVRALEVRKDVDVDPHLVVSRSAPPTAMQEAIMLHAALAARASTLITCRT